MSICPPLPTARRDRLLLAVLAPLALAASWGVQPSAVANRFVNKLGVNGVNFRLSNLVDTVLAPAAGAGKVEINQLIIAIVALVMLAAIVFFLFGILKTMGGRRVPYMSRRLGSVEAGRADCCRAPARGVPQVRGPGLR